MSEPTLDKLADSELVQRARDAGGDGGDAFRELFARWRDDVFGFLVGIVRDRALAEDVHQETFFRLFLHLDRFDPERAFRPWLYQIARNAALDALRLRRKGERLEDRKASEPAGAAPDAALEAARLEDAARTGAALDALPPEARALLIERHALGLKLEELALSWALNERTIRTRLRAAADLLARALSRKGEKP